MFNDCFFLFLIVVQMLGMSFKNLYTIAEQQYKHLSTTC